MTTFYSNDGSNNNDDDVVVGVVTICFFAADAKGLSKSSEVELLREKVYASLEAYCKQRYPEQQGR